MVERVIFVLVVGFSILAKAEVQEFTLEKATSVAISQNPELKAQSKEFESSQFAAKKAFSPFLPTLGVETGYQSFQNPDTSLTGNFKNIFGEYSIFSGGRDYYLLEAKNLRKDVSEIRFQQKRLETEWEVERAFSRLLFVTESIRFHEEAIQRNKDQQKAAAARKRAGLVSEADTLEFDVLGSILESDLTSLRGDLVDAQADFKKVLNLPESAEPFVKGRLTHFHVKSELKELFETLEKSGKTVLMAQKESEFSESLAKSVRGDFLPKISLKATYGSRDIRDAPNDRETAVWAVARWELFSGLDTYWGYREAIAESEESEYLLEASRVSARTDTEKTFALLKSLEQRVDLEGMNRERARKYFVAVASEYKRGIKNSPDMRSASEKLLESQLRDLKYRYEFIVQKIALQKITGTPVRTVVGSTEGHIE